MVLKSKPVYILGFKLNKTFWITFLTAKHYFSTLLLVILWLFIKTKFHGWRKSCIWIVNFNFKQLQEMSSTALKTSKNYTIIMTNNSNKVRVLWAVQRKNCISLHFLVLFSLKLRIAFRITQSKQPWLVKSCLNSDQYFMFKTSDTTLLETIVLYKSLPSLSQENRKTLLPP